MQRRRMVWLVLGLMVGWGGVLAWLSIARYTAYNIGMLDLGNIAQAIADGARGGPLRYTDATGNHSRLGGHAELIYFALSLVYRLWPDPRGLLVVQAALVVSGMWPVWRIARRLDFSEGGSLLFGIGYLLFPTAVAATLWDIHGDTLAMPFLLWFLLALLGRRWGWTLLLALLCVLCKWYIIAPIGLVGLSLLHPRTAPFDLAAAPGRQRLGLALTLLAASYGCFVLGALHQWFGTTTATPGNPVPLTGLAGYVAFYFGDLGQIGWFGLLDRLINLLAVLLPTALLWRKAPWTTAPALAIILPAVVTTGPGAAYAWSYHHYAAAVPFLVAGSIDGARRLTFKLPSQRRTTQTTALAGLFCGAVLVFHIGLNNTPLGLPFWRAEPGSGFSAGGYGRTSRDALKEQWLRAEVAPRTPIAVSNFLAPHVVDRSTLHLVRYPNESTAASLNRNLVNVTAAYPDALFDFTTRSGTSYAGSVDYDQDAIQELLTAPAWGLVEAQDGLLHFARDPRPDEQLAQRLQLVTDQAPDLARFGDRVALVSALAEPIGNRRWRATVRWRALQPLAMHGGFAVSRLANVPNARIVHLPVTMLRPQEWPSGVVLEEQFEWELPPEVPPGRYTWQLGWYDQTNPFAAMTDERSRIGAEVVIGLIDVQ